MLSKFNVLLVSILLTACASQSTRTVAGLDKSKVEYSSDQCRQAIDGADVQENVKLSRVVLSPALVLLSGGLLAGPVLAANIGLVLPKWHEKP